MNLTQVKPYLDSWNRCITTNISGLFFGLDKSDGQTKKAASFKLEYSEGLKEILEIAPVSLRLFMGCNPESSRESINDNPPFVPFLQANRSESQLEEHYFKMNWAPDSLFLEPQIKPADSGVNEIPAEIAYSYSLSWLKTPYNELAEAFEAYIGSTNSFARIKSCRFSVETTQKILERIQELTPNVALFLHLGKGARTPSQPFDFRPVIGIRSTVVERGGEGDEHNFDVSYPCPPLCP